MINWRLMETEHLHSTCACNGNWVKISIAYISHSTLQHYMKAAQKNLFYFGHRPCSLPASRWSGTSLFCINSAVPCCCLLACCAQDQAARWRQNFQKAKTTAAQARTRYCPAYAVKLQNVAEHMSVISLNVDQFAFGQLDMITSMTIHDNGW